MSQRYPNERTNAQLDALGAGKSSAKLGNIACRDQTDWMDLALACLDQAGLSTTAQNKIMYLLDQIGVWYTPDPKTTAKL